MSDFVDLGVYPLNDMILIEPIFPNMRQSGVLVVSAELAKVTMGIVLSVGPGKLNEKTGERNKPPYQVGDAILFLAGSIQEATLLSKEKVMFVPAPAILGIDNGE
jgi:co-chaperonin GroES (HSP10)